MNSLPDTAAPTDEAVDEKPGHHTHHDPIMHEPPGSVAALGLSPTSARLYNQDLAPTQRAGRRWTAYSIFTLWANDVHSLGNYGFAIGLASSVIRAQSLFSIASRGVSQLPPTQETFGSFR